MTQREEILVSKLIGATDSFIHRPFYYTGALLGLCAGGLALGAVALALRPLNTAIAEFARLYASEFQLAPLQPVMMACLLALSAGLLIAWRAFGPEPVAPARTDVVALREAPHADTSASAPNGKS